MAATGTPRKPMLVWAFMVLLASGVANAKPRVRKELRSLNSNEWNLYVTALTIMINTPMEQGQAQYGPAYREYNYFIVKHAVAVLDPRGDQGHFGPCFITFHRALLLEFEAAVLSVSPRLGAIPYWDVLMDVRGGPYVSSKTQYMFSSNYAGTIAPGKNNGYSPKDGIFSWRPIPSFDWERYGQWAHIFNGSLDTGLLRGPESDTTNPFVARFDAIISPPNPRSKTKTCYYSDGRKNELPFKYSIADWQLCLNSRIIKTHTDWQWCIDMGGFESSLANTPGVDKAILKTCSHLVHPAPHFLVGGFRSDGTPGDFNDITTAPNEVLLFMLHHANLDRSHMIWQKAVMKVNPSVANQDVLWYYPSDRSLFVDMDSPFVDGCYLHDTIASAMPFTDIFPGQSSENPDGFTHADVLWHTRPGSSSYVYDNMGTGRGKKAPIRRS